MKGFIKHIVAQRNFGFIRAGTQEYFFHREEFNGHWEDLLKDADEYREIPVEFEPVTSPKGPRAAGVKRLDYPN